MTWFKWSRDPGPNATADSTINWAEGQSPSSVNDSARAMMAAAAKYRDDMAGAITTAGTSTAYTLASFQDFDSLANMSGKAVAFVPHATNGATVTLNVDGLGAKPLRSAPSTELGAGVLIQGTPYVAVYNNSTVEWVLHGFYGNSYNIPLGGLLPFTGDTAPNSNFVLPYGQAISRTTYATYFNLSGVGTTYGVGDGSTTFNVPDLRGRIPAGVDNMGGSSASRLTSGANGLGTPAILGAVGGGESLTLAVSQIPALTCSGTTGNDNTDHTHTFTRRQSLVTVQAGTGASNMWQNDQLDSTGGVSVNHQHAFTGTTSGGGGAHRTIQPTIVLSYILRII